MKPNLSDINEIELRKELRKRNQLRKKRSRKAKGLEPRTRTPMQHIRMRNGHEYVNGMLAHVQRRLEIFRNAGGEAVLFTESPCYVEEISPATCQGCAEAHLVGWNEGEWHHNVKSKGGKRCDCAACGKFVCPTIHEIYRNRIIP